MKIISVAVVFLLFTGFVFAQDYINKSPALELLLTQIEKQFVPQHWNKGMDEIAITIPQLYVTFLGTAMRKQESHLDRYPASFEKFEILNAEIESLIPKIANAYDYANASNNNGKKINVKTLEGIYYSALMGDLSEIFLTNYKNKSGNDIRSIQIPYMIDKVQEPSYKKAPKKDDAIVFLGEEVLPESSRKDLGNSIITGLKCPMKSDKDFEIDTNDNPDDKTCIKCKYSQYSIYQQVALVNGYNHGENFEFFDYDLNDDIPHIMTKHGYYNNGKMHGVWEEYWYRKEVGKAIIRYKTEYNQGIKLWDENYALSFEKKDSDRIVYLDTRTLYVNGKRSETTFFYKNKRKQMHVSIVDGESVKDGCWEEDGTRIPCPSYW